MKIYSIIILFAKLYLIRSQELCGGYGMEINQSILKKTNDYRSQNQVGPLSLSDELANDAQHYAMELAATDNGLRHSGKPGENLYYNSNTQDNQGGDYGTVAYWYNEAPCYQGVYDESTFKSYGHFIQLVWKETTEMGCGSCRGESGKLYVVCRYRPPGNVATNEYFQKNVLQPYGEEAAQRLGFGCKY